MTTNIHNRIRERLKILGLTPEAASKKAGFNRDYLRKLLEREGSAPRGQYGIDLAGALETPAPWLLTGEGSPNYTDVGHWLRQHLMRSDKTEPELAAALNLLPEAIASMKRGEQPMSKADLEIAARYFDVSVPSFHQSSMPHSSNVRQADLMPPHIHELARDLPVYGTTAGSHRKGSVQISSDPVDYVRRPPALLGVKTAYSLFVEGDSMSPRHRHGDLLFVRADRKARIGDDVVVILQNGEHDDRESFVAELLKLGSDQIVIGKLNPAAEIALDRAKIHAVHKVLTMADLFEI